MQITGRELIRLLLADGWTIKRRARHGLWMEKRTEQGLLTTTVKDVNHPIGQNTLKQILGPTQTGLGSTGLRRLMELHR